MIARRIALSVGLVLLLVGIVGLLSPVSVSPGLRTVSCGTAVAPDLAAAREQPPDQTEVSTMELPNAGEEVGSADYTELCRYELSDRRAWTITLAAAGALLVAVGGALTLRARRGSG